MRNVTVLLMVGIGLVCSANACGALVAGDAIFLDLNGVGNAVSDPGPLQDAGRTIWNHVVSPDGGGSTGATYADVVRASDGAPTGISLTTQASRNNGAWGSENAYTERNEGRGVPMDSDLYEDFSRHGNSSARDSWRLTGLPVGVYEIYYMINSDKSAGFGGGGAGEFIYIGVDDDSVSEIDGHTAWEIENWSSTGGGTGMWVRHDSAASPSDWNYIKQTVTITDAVNDGVEFMHGPVDSNNQRNGPAALQIVAVPEPVSLVLMGFAGVLLLGRSRH